MKKIEIYDTTLRDGAQTEGLSFSVEDKIRITKALDEFGIDFIEGGFAGSNPKDAQFFNEIKKHKLKNSKIVAFATTIHPKKSIKNDLNIKAVLDFGCEYVAIVGKSWDLHVEDVLNVSLKRNIEIIFTTINFLTQKGFKVFFDAEHFFDGYKENKNYALETIKVAEKAGAQRIVLCDTNGGSLPDIVIRGVKDAKKTVKSPLGIHIHNDVGLAISNTILAVKEGVKQVQGTINGYGERCGNADLIVLIPNFQLKMGIQCVKSEKLRFLKSLSHFVSELANMNPMTNQPYVGDSAFAHKAGIHISGLRKNLRAYEHIDPFIVGNKRRTLISELSGKSNIKELFKRLNIPFPSDHNEFEKIAQKLKELENKGYQFEGAEASFELLVREMLGERKRFFKLAGFRVTDFKREEGKVFSEATIKVKVGKEYEHTAAEGNGPVNSLDNALRKALEKFYPSLKDVKLTDYKVRVLNEGGGTGSKVRVLIQSKDKKSSWGTVGVSHNVIQASWDALVDSIEYKLLKDTLNSKEVINSQKEGDL